MNHKVTTLSRILLGLIMLTFGLNKFLHFIPMPELHPEFAKAMGGLMHVSYLFPLVAVVEILSGISFLLNKAVPLFLLILAPVVVNIFLIHVFYDMSGMPLAGITTLLTAYLFYHHRKTFKALVK